jgi:uncharacterized protein YfaP (DUF2135 family)
MLKRTTVWILVMASMLAFVAVWRLEAAPPPVAPEVALLPMPAVEGTDLSKAALWRSFPAAADNLPALSPEPPSFSMVGDIYGRVTAAGVPLAGISVTLRCYVSTNEWPVLTVATGADGYYHFANVPSLDVGQTYYVRYGSNITDTRYVYMWYGRDITTYTAGQVANSVGFDIANVPLVAPAHGATVSLPVLVSWVKRSTPHNYWLHTYDAQSYWETPTLGDVTQVFLSALGAGMLLNTPYHWTLYVQDAPSSFGISYEARRVTFVSASATPTTTSLVPTRTATATATRTPIPSGSGKVYLPLIQRSVSLITTTLRDSKGNAVGSLPRSDSLYAEYTDLEPRTMYDVYLLDPSGNTLTISRFTADGQGRIPSSALAYDLGLTMVPPQGANVAAVLQEIGTHTVSLRDRSGRELRRWFMPVTEPSGPILYAANVQGLAVNSFLAATQTVYARGERFPPNTTVPIYVVADQLQWSVGASLADASGGVKNASVGADGTFLIPVWVNPPASTTGLGFDLVADLDRSGNYSTGDVVDSHTPVGFMVQRLSGPQHIQVQLACDVNRNYKDLFTAAENVYIYVNPPTQQLAHKFGYKYIVAHRNTWVGFENLNDITEGPERDHPQWGCTNEGRVLMWPAPLTPGIYDAVLDVNGNGIYDIGVDLLDNIDVFGNAVGGFFVPGSANAPAVTITAPANGSTTSNGVITLTGLVTTTSPVTWARWYVNAGTQSSSGEIMLAQGRFSQTIYLFPGLNTVQVWVRNASGASVASIAVTSGVQGVWDIHAQLVWDVTGADEDLHLRRPSGSRNTSGDCYYSNCRGSSRAANPDWGVVGQADDNPALDVDHTTDAPGPENITLNTQGRAEANGRYTVEVYYYSDHSKGPAHPRVNLWVRGRLHTFGPVTTTHRQWWTVCTIDWPSGLVSAVGTVAARPELEEEMMRQKGE